MDPLIGNDLPVSGSVGEACEMACETSPWKRESEAEKAMHDGEEEAETGRSGKSAGRGSERKVTRGDAKWDTEVARACVNRRRGRILHSGLT